MKTRILAVLCIFVMVLLFAAPIDARTPPGDGLNPGEYVVFEQTIPINLVFVGYEEGTLDEGELLAELPAAYEPVVRFPRFYGISGRPIGLHFNFDYNVQYTDSHFEDQFFGYLRRTGQPGDLSAFQEMYNQQENNVLDVTSPVLYIDAPSVEAWLERHSRIQHIDTQRSYTIYFINWYSRDDFQFHVYTKTDEVDPDTGYNFGEQRASRLMIAWGGSSGRTWFYDLSAGPEAWTNNWNITDADLDGDDVPDYRMPPIWEYAPDGYRDPAVLDNDLGRVTRFVGINLLFTSSPLYDPLNTAPAPDGEKIVHIEMFEDDPDASGLNWIDTQVIHRKLAAYEPYYDWTVNLDDNDPIDPEAQRAFRIFAEILEEDDCWNAFGTPFAELFCFFDANLDQYVPEYDPEDYVAEVFSFNTTDENLGVWFGLLGYADDNWTDGTQTFVFQFDTPTYRDLGYGFTTTTIHEVGHHIGVSHPHDGYDSELGIDYGPSGDFYYVWSGDESDTVMHYLALSNGFGQFDQDNMYRFEMAGYLNWTNDLLDDVLAHPDADRVRSRVTRAERHAQHALQAFERWDYLRAAAEARAAYVLIARAADELGIPTAPSTFSTLSVPATTPTRLVDPIRFPDE